MKKPPATKVKEISFDQGKEMGKKKGYRMLKSKAAVEAMEDEAKQTVKFVSTSIVQMCRENKLKPGWALLGVCEFLAMMVHQNMPIEAYTEELERFTSYIDDRLKEFNSHDVTH